MQSQQRGLAAIFYEVGEDFETCFRQIEINHSPSLIIWARQTDQENQVCDRFKRVTNLGIHAADVRCRLLQGRSACQLIYPRQQYLWVDRLVQYGKFGPIRRIINQVSMPGKQ